MVPLAVSGQIILGGAVGLALLLVWFFFRQESREEARERADRER